MRTSILSPGSISSRSYLEATVTLPAVEEIVQRNIFIYDFVIQEGEYLGELARQILGTFDKTVKLLRFNNHIIRTNDIDSFFKCFRCPSCDTFFNKHLLRCRENM